MSDKMTWHTEKRRVRDLVPAEWNPRQMTKEQADALRASLDTFDLVEIPAINTDNMILAGHQRVAILAQQGRMDEEIDVRVPSRTLTQDEAMRYNVTSNKVVGEFDLDKLLAMPEEILKSSGFTDKEITKLVDGNAHSIDDDLDIDEEVKKDARVSVGDIWQLGRHRIVCGDSTDPVTIHALFDGKRADICFTSPPYNLGDNSKLRGWLGTGKDTVYEKYDDKKTEDQWHDFMVKWTNVAMDFCEYVFCNVQFLAGNRTALPTYWYDLRESFCDVVIWNKNHAAPALARNCMNSVFEFVFIFKKENPSRSINTGNFHGNVSNIISIEPHKTGNEFASIHGATFPLPLADYFIKTFSQMDMIIFDPFIGTGTTLISAEQLGRSCFGCDIDPLYCTIVIDRWEKLTGQKATKVQQ